MKRIVIVLATAAMIAALLVVGPVAAQTKTQTIITNEPFDVTIENFCSGFEEIHIEGTVHTVTHITEDAAGGLHVTYRFAGQAQGEATSATDGSTVKYVLTQAGDPLEGTLNIPASSAENFTVSEHGRLIRQGEEDSPHVNEDDLIFSFLIHYTRDANGEYHAFVGTGYVLCH